MVDLICLLYGIVLRSCCFLCCCLLGIRSLLSIGMLFGVLLICIVLDRRRIMCKSITYCADAMIVVVSK